MKSPKKSEKIPQISSPESDEQIERKKKLKLKKSQNKPESNYSYM